MSNQFKLNGVTNIKNNEDLLVYAMAGSQLDTEIDLHTRYRETAPTIVMQKYEHIDNRFVDIPMCNADNITYPCFVNIQTMPMDNTVYFRLINEETVRRQMDNNACIGQDISQYVMALHALSTLS